MTVLPPEIKQTLKSAHIWGSLKIQHTSWVTAPFPLVLTSMIYRCPHLGCGGDDSLQRCRGPRGISRVTAWVLCAVVMMIVTVGGRGLQQLFPTWRRLCLGVEGRRRRG